MASDTNQDQLIQDASTLLMFADVAAKQLQHNQHNHLQPHLHSTHHSHHLTPTPPPPPSHHQQQQPQPHHSHHHPPPPPHQHVPHHLNAQSPIQPPALYPPPPRLRHRLDEPSLPPAHIPPQYLTSPNLMSHLPPHHLYQHNTPVLHLIPPSGHIVHHNNMHQPAHHHSHHHPSMLPLFQPLPPTLGFDPDPYKQRHNPPIGRFAPPEPFRPVPIHSHASESSSSNTTSRSRPLSRTAESSPPFPHQSSHRRGVSHNSIPHLNAEEAAKTQQRLSMSNLVSPSPDSVPAHEPPKFSKPRVIAPSRSTEAARATFMPLHISPSAPSHARQAHRRTVSNPQLNPHLAPGKFSTMQGISLGTLERNSSNAMIAAAALAAAAEVPLPLKSKSPKAIANNTAAAEKRLEAVAAAVAAQAEAAAASAADGTADIASTATIPATVSTPATATALAPIPAAPPNDQKVRTSRKKATKDSSKTETKPVDVKKTSAGVPSLNTYRVDPDSGVIGCICEITDDDGFTIQCDICYRWQHCLCMGFETSLEIPEDEYKCYFCDDKKWGMIDAEKCHRDTLARIERDHADDESPKTTPHQTLKRKVLSAEKAEKKRKSEDALATEKNLEFSGSTGGASASAGTFANSGAAAATTTTTSSSSLNGSADSAQSPDTIIDDLPNKENELLTNGVTAELYQSVYFKLKTNDYKNYAVKSMFEDWGRTFSLAHSRLSKADQRKLLGGIEVMSAAQLKAIKWSRVDLPNYTKYLESSHKMDHAKKSRFNKTVLRVGPYTDNQKQKFNGLSKLALFIAADSGDAAMEIPAETPIIEYVGELGLFQQYATEKANQYALWGTTMPHVVEGHMQIEQDSVNVVIDSRFVGNESRFIRKSCPAAANCRIKAVYVPEQNLFKFLVVTTQAISLGGASVQEELRIPWNWAFSLAMKQLDSGSMRFENLEDEEKAALIACVDNILYFTECGCSTSSSNLSCSFFKVKKAMSLLARSSKKALGISNVNLAKPKDELIKFHKQNLFEPWEERFFKRDQVIKMRLTVSTPKTENAPDTAKCAIDAEKKINGGGDHHTENEESVKKKKKNNNNENKNENGNENNVKNTNHNGDGGGDGDGELERERKPLTYFNVPFKLQLTSAQDTGVQLDTQGEQDDAGEYKISDTQPLPFMIDPQVSKRIDLAVEAQLEPVLSVGGTTLVLKPTSSNSPDAGDAASANAATTNATATTAARKVSNPNDHEPIPAAATMAVLVPTPSLGTAAAAAAAAVPIPLGVLLASCDVTDPTAQLISPPSPPPVVKKLSFADYKKKKM